MRRVVTVLTLCVFVATGVPALSHAAHGDGALININTADVETLKELEGIGTTLAERIVDYREAHGPFTTIEQIIHPTIDRLWESTFVKIKDHITVGETTQNTSDAATTTQAQTPTETVFNTITQYQYETVTIEPPQDVYLRVPEHIVTTVGASTEFVAESYDATGAALTGGTVSWSFGDGSAGTGRVVSHQFAYEGEYTVTATLESGSLTDQQHIQATVVPLVATLTIAEDGEWVAIGNGSEYELNLSSWRITSNGQYFIIPEHTFIAPLKVVRFATDVTGLSFLRATQEAALRFPDNAIAVVGEVASDEEDVLTQATTTIATTTTTTSAQAQKTPASTVLGTSVPRSNTTDISANTPQTPEAAPVEQVSTTTQQTAAAVSSLPKESSKNDIYWYLALGALLTLAAGALLLLRKQPLIVEGFEVTEVKK